MAIIQTFQLEKMNSSRSISCNDRIQSIFSEKSEIIADGADIIVGNGAFADISGQQRDRDVFLRYYMTFLIQRLGLKM
jgi:hypothetical protein